MRSVSWLRGLAADLRYAARTLRRAPAFTLAAVVSLALAIGANTAIFALLDAVLLRPLPIPRAGQLVAVARIGDTFTETTFRFEKYAALRDAVPALALQAGGQADNVVAESRDARDYVHADWLTGGYHATLGVRPLLGRTLGPDDDREAAAVVVLGERTWERFFARDPGVLGKPLTLNGRPFVVVGVLPAAFRGVVFNGRFELAVPQRALATVLPVAARRYVHVIARRDVASRAAFSASLDAAYRRCCLDPDGDARAHVQLIDVSRGIPGSKNDFRGEYARVLGLLMAGVLIVLLVACSNVGNLLLARGTSRRRELSVRLAIGAARSRVVRQLLAECALLAVAGAAAGMLLAAWATAALVTALPAGFESEASLVSFRATAPVLAFTTAVCALCVVACGLGPALRATRGGLAERLGDRGGSRSVTRRDGAAARALVVVQVALTLVLVSGASLCVATLRNLRAVDPGFAPDHLIMFSVETRGTRLDEAGIIPVHADILDRVRQVPGVRSAGMATRIPAFGGRSASFTVELPGMRERPEVDVTVVTPDYLRTARTALLAGRDFDARDGRAAEPVAIVNEAFARRLLGGASPLGRTIRVVDDDHRTLTIVGVARDVRFGDRRTPQDPMIYVPAAQAGQWPFLEVMVRATGDPRALVAPLRGAVQSVAPDVRVTRWQTMDEAFDEVLLRERLVATLGAGFALLALTLAMVGLAGVVAYGVARRVREIGVRMALGARRPRIVWLVLRESLAMVGAGVVVASPLALVLGRAMGALLYGVAPTDPRVLVGSALALLAAGAAAAALPAWRASLVHLATSLRSD
ncbi:permease [Gemmatirosa kalamazoonensis]|uniref:Permease n=1 Tax=Gemmatirosa kalamazoonensis TaxID=861299 RepID=W0RFJ9_9BACT|nr:ABC transporter permease [Gemmatirosa kalamazoonensis]AHG89576.1 permease [Gemmatirosa kalamazoonensis]